ncbi:MAG: hypothetical protein RLZZ591_1880 [Pseudomonadota bacterium]|jgi:hypothetical protein
MSTSTSSATALGNVQRPAPAQRSEAVTASKTQELAKMEADKQAAKEAPARPVINTQGQTTGRLLNVKA